MKATHRADLLYLLGSGADECRLERIEPNPLFLFLT
jgi:hypothetical protein